MTKNFRINIKLVLCYVLIGLGGAINLNASEKEKKNLEPSVLTTLINQPFESIDRAYGYIKDKFNTKIYNRFDNFHNNILYQNDTKEYAPGTYKFPKDNSLNKNIHNLDIKKMRSSAKWFTRLMPLVFIAKIVLAPNVPALTIPTSIPSLPNINTVSIIAKTISSTSVDNKDYAVAMVASASPRILSYKIFKTDTCIHPLTWFSEKADHPFFLNTTNFVITALSWIHFFYSLKTIRKTGGKNLAAFISLHLGMRYMLYLHNKLTETAYNDYNITPPVPLNTQKEADNVLASDKQLFAHVVSENMKLQKEIGSIKADLLINYQENINQAKHTYETRITEQNETILQLKESLKLYRNTNL